MIMAEIIASTYEIIEKIGSGGGGVVYLANHMRLGKKVVLKADKRKLTTRPEILRREVDALKDLSHTYIPQVYDFFAEGETVYTVIDYVEGESLDKPLKRGERFSQPQVIKWACQILEALCYLHSPIHGTPPKGIVHSDIKPANIMLTPQGNICLIDFNIALALGEENIVGRSAGYASPEHYGLDFSTDSSYMDNDDRSVSQDPAVKATEAMPQNVYEAETVTMGNAAATQTMADISAQKKSEYSSSSKKIVIPDARSDIYSLGATLYHLLSGVRPARNAKEVVHLSTENISPLIVKIITKAMDPNPDMRYQSAEDMLYDFTHLRENDPRTKTRKRAFKIGCIIFSVLVAGSIATSFLGLKRMEQFQNSLNLAELSQNAFAEGNIQGALEYASEAIDKGNILIPSYTPQAQKALTDALGVYDLSDGFKSYGTKEMPSEIFKIALSPDGKTGIGIYSFEAAVFDVESGESIALLPIISSALSDAVFVDNEIIVYAGENGITAYNVKENKELWTGKPATHIAVSSDGQTVAGIYRDEGFATVYDINGNEKTTVSFSGNKQKVVENDTFADPMDNLLALSADGKYMAVSFANGGLTVYDISNSENNIEIYDKSDFTHFEGGFSGKYFAFSGTKNGLSEFAVIDTAELTQTIGLQLDILIGVKTDEKNICIYNKSTAVTIDPETGEQTELAYADADIRALSTDGEKTVVITDKNEYLFYDKDADLISRYSGGQRECVFTDISGCYALIAGRDSPIIRILKIKELSQADVFTYDPSYTHDEARMSDDGNRLLLFSYNSFRLCDKQGNIIKELPIPDAEKVYDQQYSRKSGNLAVMYKDALRIYSGTTGEPIFEETGLRSVFYAPYGVSIVDGNGTLRLIDIDTGEAVVTESFNGSAGAYCGTVIGDDIINGGRIVGAAHIDNGYVFAVENEGICSVYDDKKNKKFEVPVEDQSEAFFTDKEVIISPLHGTPAVYCLKNGKKIADLEKDSYLTYITPLGDNIVSEYIAASGERYGILLNKKYEALAYLPELTDISDNRFIFDFDKGMLRQAPIYSIDELMAMK